MAAFGGGCDVVGAGAVEVTTTGAGIAAITVDEDAGLVATTAVDDASTGAATLVTVGDGAKGAVTGSSDETGDAGVEGGPVRAAGGAASTGCVVLDTLSYHHQRWRAWR